MEIRESHFRAERSLRALGSFYLFQSILFVLAAIAASLDLGSLTLDSLVESFSMVALIMIISILLLAVGLELRNLKPTAAGPAKCLSIFGLFVFPVGTIINAMALSSLCSKKGKFVLSEKYQEIIEETPMPEEKTSTVAKILLILTILLLATLCAFFFA